MIDSSCSLHLPHPNWSDSPDELDNYRYLENWSTRFVSCFHGITAADVPLLNAVIQEAPTGYYQSFDQTLESSDGITGVRQQIGWHDRALVGGVIRDPTELWDGQDGAIIDSTTGTGRYNMVMGYILPPGSYMRLDVNLQVNANLASSDPAYSQVTPGLVELSVYQVEYPGNLLYNFTRTYTTPRGGWYGSAGITNNDQGLAPPITFTEHVAIKAFLTRASVLYPPCYLHNCNIVADILNESDRADYGPYP
jgi:hypothetical protein